MIVSISFSIAFQFITVVANKPSIYKSKPIIKQALSLIEKGENNEALLLLEKVIETSKPIKQLYEAHFLASKIALKKNDLDKAILYLKELDKKMPEIKDFVWNMQAETFFLKEKFNKSYSIWKHLLHKYPQSPLREKALLGLADSTFMQSKEASNLKKAKNLYLKILKKKLLKDKKVYIYFRLGKIFLLLNDFQKATKYFDSIVYDYPFHHLNTKAKKHINQFMQNKKIPEYSTQEKFSKIKRLLKKKAIGKAYSMLKLIKISKNDTYNTKIYMYYKAQILRRKKKYKEAIVILKELIKIESAQKKLIHKREIANIYLKSGNNKKAIEILLYLAEQKNPLASKDLFQAAWFSYNSNEYEQAILLFKQFIQLYPHKKSKKIDAFWFIAWNAYKNNDINTARVFLEKIINIKPSSVLNQRSHYWLGKIYARQNKINIAKKYYTTAIDIDPLSYYGILSQKRLDTYLLNKKWGKDLFDVNASKELAPSPSLLEKDIFDWKSPLGKRALRLFYLGIYEEFGNIIKKMKPLPEYKNQISYYILLLLHDIHRYHNVYLLTFKHYKKFFKKMPTEKSLPYFKLSYPLAYPNLVSKASKEFSISPFILLALMRQESAFLKNAQSIANAKGLMQILPKTGKLLAKRLKINDFKVKNLNMPHISIHFGAYYLSELLKKFQGHIVLAIGSYNSGPKAMGRFIKRYSHLSTDEFIETIPFKETRYYIKHVISNLSIYNQIYENKFISYPKDIPNTYLNNINF